jgi:hypothetical protein
MIAVNEQASGAVNADDPNTAPMGGSPMGNSPRLKVAIDGPDPEVVVGNEARNMAMARAAREGFATGGLNGPPIAVPIRADNGLPLDEKDAFGEAAKDVKIACYRGEFLFNSK